VSSVSSWSEHQFVLWTKFRITSTRPQSIYIIEKLRHLEQ